MRTWLPWLVIVLLLASGLFMGARAWVYVDNRWIDPTVNICEQQIQGLRFVVVCHEEHL